MPRSPTVLTPPPGTLPFTPNTTIESGKANAVWLDLYQDGNTPRPIEYGGTGASNAADALSNLGGVGQSNFLEAFSIGDGYYSARDISAEGGVWLRRDGALYSSSTYPELGALLPALPDGVTWTASTVFSSGVGQGLITTPSGFMLMNDDGANTKVYTSTDAVSWGVVATISGFRARNALVYGGGIYVTGSAFVGSISASADGFTWGSPTAVNSMTSITALAYGAGVFVAVADGGKISTSPDAVTWTSRTSGVSELFFNVRFVNSLFVATGANGTIVTSPDGITWTVRTSGVTNIITDVVYGAGLYVFVGTSGLILTTSNLTAFTTRTSGTAQDLLSVTYSSAGFVTVGGAGTARISTDAISWVASATGVSNTLNTIIFDPDSPATYFATGNGFITGLRTLSTQFRVPKDPPEAIAYGWIKARND